MRILHLLWPHLPIELARRRWTASHLDSEPFPAGPIVLGGQPWTDAPVLDADGSARDLGIRRGIPLGAAHRLAPEATFLDPEPEADRAAVEAALDRLAAISPGIAGTSDVGHPAFGLLEVQLDGLDRLWGPEPEIVARLGRALDGVLPGRPRAGIAGTRFAASLAALAGPTVVDGPLRARAVPPGDDASFLGSQPAAVLSRDPDARARLARFGLRTVGAVAAIPRSALIARFGSEGERLHDRARGVEDAPFRPRRTPERLALGLALEPPVGELEALRFVLHRLAGALGDQLLARGAATGRVRLGLWLDRTFSKGVGGEGTGPPDARPRASGGGSRPSGDPAERVVDQRLPEPTAEAEAIERLLLARLEREAPPAPVARLELELAEVAPATGQQLSLFVPQAARSARLAWQLARLALAFGEDRVGRAVLGDPEARLPEDRWCWEPIGSGAVVEPAESGPATLAPIPVASRS